MSSPTRRSSVAHIPAIGPSSSLLQRLLQEVNDNDAPRSGPIFATNDGPRSGKDSLATSRRASLNCNIPPPQRRSSSVWAKGGSVAEDARQKLRALDEARLRKQSTAQFDSLATSPSAIVSKKTSPALPSPPFFTEFQFNRAATTSMADHPSPTSERPDNFFNGKRERSGTYSPDLITKRLRQDSFSDMACRNREYCSPSTPPSEMMRGGGSIVTTHVQSATSDDPILRLEPLPEAPSSPPSPLYGFRSTPKHAYKPFRPATPRRSPTPSDGASPGATPAWARPLHLVEEDFSIYKNVHGDKSREHPLCLYCFRQHGDFHRMVDRRCEVCGRNEVLEGHYWEAPFWAQ